LTVITNLYLLLRGSSSCECNGGHPWNMLDIPFVSDGCLMVALSVECYSMYYVVRRVTCCTSHSSHDHDKVDLKNPPLSLHKQIVSQLLTRVFCLHINIRRGHRFGPESLGRGACLLYADPRKHQSGHFLFPAFFNPGLILVSLRLGS
jgi:hypothetical protein